jgi:hypothetical protein
MKHELFFLVLTLCIISCNNPQITDPNNPEENEDIYVVGFENNGVNDVAKYWKNGVAINLTDCAHDAESNAIAIIGNDVYVAGFKHNGNVYVAKYWKNGVAISLSNEQNDASATSIFVSGNDVYVAGFETEGQYLNAKYWKNGQPVNITNNTWACVLSIYVRNNDVYTAGFEVSDRYDYMRYFSSPNEPHWYFMSQAAYWKNGNKTELFGGNKRYYLRHACNDNIGNDRNTCD